MSATLSDILSRWVATPSPWSVTGNEAIHVAIYAWNARQVIKALEAGDTNAVQGRLKILYNLFPEEAPGA